MLQSLGWRSLEQRRSDSRLCLFYKIIYGLVANDVPPYVVHPSRILKNSHPLSFRQIQTTVDYYKYSFYLLAIVQWNRLPSHISLLHTFESFKRTVCAVNHSIPLMSARCCYNCQLVSDILTLSFFTSFPITNFTGTLIYNIPSTNNAQTRTCT